MACKLRKNKGENSYIPYDSNYMTFWKRQKNYAESKKDQRLPRGGERGMWWTDRAQRIFTAVKILYDTIMMDTFHYIFVTTHRMYRTKNKSCWLWVIMMSQCRFKIVTNTLVGDIDIGGGCARHGSTRYVGKSLYLACNFAVNLNNTVLKGKVLLKNHLTIKKKNFHPRLQTPLAQSIPNCLYVTVSISSINSTHNNLVFNLWLHQTHSHQIHQWPLREPSETLISDLWKPSGPWL